MINKEKNQDGIFDRVPPQALEAERAVLGSMMLSNDAIGATSELLCADAFYRTADQHVFTAAIRLYEKSYPVDLITLSDELKSMGVLEDIGGVYYLTELAESVPSAANVEFHARIVQEKYLLRRMIAESAEIAKACYDPAEEAKDILDRAEQRIFDISRIKKTKGFSRMAPMMRNAVDRIEERRQAGRGLIGIPTGFEGIDRLLCGMQKSDLIIVAGRPSMGKTAFALNAARHAAGAGYHVAIFSLEMSQEQLASRLICADAHVDAQRMRHGELMADEMDRLSMKIGKLSEAPIVVDDTAGLTVLEIRARARRLKRVDLIVVDYLQLISDPAQRDRVQEVSAISRGLKGLAKDLNVPVMALSQLSRAVEMRGGEKRPVLADLRDSGAIEQDADVVMFLYRAQYYGIDMMSDGSSSIGKAEVIVAKQRNGPTGTVELMFSPAWASFENLAG